MEVGGECDSDFDVVAAAFRENFARHGDVGAAVCVYHRGRPVVDLWADWADERRRLPWQQDTLQLVFSTTKGIAATCVHLLIERGALDLDTPVSEYWPEFAARGKGEILLRWVLSHEAGLAAATGPVTMEDVPGRHGVIDAIAAQAPVWELDTAHGYHARSYGWILGEVIRRTTGKGLGTCFEERIAEPFDLDFFVGLPAGEVGRVAHLHPPVIDPATKEAMDAFMGPDTLSGQVVAGPSGSFGHAGAGDSVGLADPDGEWSLGYVMNQMQLGLTGDVRSVGLVAAVFAPLGGLGHRAGHAAVGGSSAGTWLAAQR